jgi:hypothetical protein
MAPTSAPSVTHKPTKKPEIITCAQDLQPFQFVSESDATDKIAKLNAIDFGASPQHAYEKGLLFNEADIPASRPTIGLNLAARQKYHVDKPRNNKDKGTFNFE